MQDFTLTTYKKLLEELLTNSYSFQTLQDFIQEPENKTVILRHDVDRKPGNALVVAAIEKEAGIKASYYFRIVKESYDENIIKQIADLGHEIGYHYEDMDLSSRGQRSEVRGQKELDDSVVFDKAIKSFERNLSILREVVPVKTICMHGSPLSKWDNRDLWKRYNYRDYGIIAEPYFDVDFSEVLYLTDTGRAWNNSNASLRDKVNSKFDIKIKDTNHLIEKIQNNELPDKIMINVHPQRWTDNPVEWMKELVWQNVKNVVKRLMLKLRD
jgi:hypothetical protein